MKRNEDGERSQHSDGDRGHGESRLADDQLYRVLAARTRRRLLYYQLEAEESTVDELAEVLVGWEADETGGMGTTDDYKQLVTRLRHAHLPALADAGFVQYDDATGRVTLGEIDDSISDLIERSIAAEKG